MKTKIIPVQEWRNFVESGNIADYEAVAYPIINGKVSTYHMLVPSDRGKDIPTGTEKVEIHLH